jgi:hypothetical protein
MMRETANSADNQTKRVTVRTGGAGHAHSGIVHSEILSATNAAAAGAAPAKRAESSNGSKIVRLGS